MAPMLPTCVVDTWSGCHRRRAREAQPSPMVSTHCDVAIMLLAEHHRCMAYVKSDGVIEHFISEW